MNISVLLFHKNIEYVVYGDIIIFRLDLKDMVLSVICVTSFLYFCRFELLKCIA